MPTRGRAISVITRPDPFRPGHFLTLPVKLRAQPLSSSTGTKGKCCHCDDVKLTTSALKETDTAIRNTSEEVDLTRSDGKTSDISGLGRKKSSPVHSDMGIARALQLYHLYESDAQGLNPKYSAASSAAPPSSVHFPETHEAAADACVLKASIASASSKVISSTQTTYTAPSDSTATSSTEVERRRGPRFSTESNTTLKQEAISNWSSS